MAIPYEPSKIEVAKLSTMKWGDSFNVVFESLSGSVAVKVGGNVALITRDELAAAATLFPVERHSAIGNRK